MIGGGSATDPFRFNETSQLGFSNPTGITQISSIIAAPLTTKTIITGGQSNFATACGTSPYSTVSSSANQLSIYDGGMYRGSNTVLGCSFNTALASVNMMIADSMISRSKATQAIVVPVAVGGTIYTQWVPTANATLFGRISTAILRCRARGLEPDAIFWGEGENDNTLGTSSASITSSIQAIVDGIRVLNCHAPFYVGLYTMVSGVTSSSVRTGILNSIETPRNIKLGYDADTNCTVAGGFRAVDGTHLSNTGLALAATGWTTIAFP